jgi:hypothetical protein
MKTNIQSSFSISNSVGMSQAFLRASEIMSDQNVEKLFIASIEIMIKGTYKDLVDLICGYVDSKLIRTEPFFDGFLIVFDKLVIKIDHQGKMFHSFNRDTHVFLYGEYETIEKIHDRLGKHVRQQDTYVHWSFMTERGMMTKTVLLEVKNTPRDSFYPWIGQGIASFVQSYIDSDASILLLLGEPGTGKTTFIRHLIHSQKLGTTVTYDDNMMATDQFFADFVTGHNDLLVLEDADVLLRDRTQGNKTMNKLLNVSDGLISLKKKIVMTANITSLNEIDPALIRPGRCFETLMFRELSLIEAKAVAAEMNLPEPEERTTLSRLFSTGPTTKPSTTMGFAL